MSNRLNERVLVIDLVNQCNCKLYYTEMYVLLDIVKFCCKYNVILVFSELNVDVSFLCDFDDA